jgi:hypothetical protein
MFGSMCRERNVPPKMFTQAEKDAALNAHH